MNQTKNETNNTYEHVKEKFMVGAPVDFATVQWARKRTADLEPLINLSATDIAKLAGFLEKLAALKEAGTEPTTAQLTVLLQNLGTKSLDSLEAVKGGLSVCFSGGGFEMESFLLRPDGRIPNHKYQSTKG